MFETVCYEIYKDEGFNLSIGSYYIVFIGDDILNMEVECGHETVYLIGDEIIYEIYLDEINIINETPETVTPYKVKCIDNNIEHIIDGITISFEDEEMEIFDYKFKNIIIESVFSYHTNIDHTSIIIPVKMDKDSLDVLVLSIRAERGYYKLEF
jgi:hypothetical protein